MTNIMWPTSIPQLLRLDGQKAQRKNNVIRTQMDAGPSKARKRYTVSEKLFEGTIIVTEEERQILENWYRDTLGDGTLRFAMKDPQSLQLSEFRFTEDYTEVSLEGLWKITMKLEKLNA